MLSVQNIGGLNSSSISFGNKHLPRDFSSMMNYIYKNTPDFFEHSNAMRVSTVLENGMEVSGTANFLDGSFHNLVMDDGFEKFKNTFMRTALNRYNAKLSNGRHNKLSHYV